MKVSADIVIAKRIEIEIPCEYEYYIRPFFKDDSERTAEDWYMILENNDFCLTDLFSIILNEDVQEVELLNYKN
jgi:hypothetical protein